MFAGLVGKGGPGTPLYPQFDSKGGPGSPLYPQFDPKGGPGSPLYPQFDPYRPLPPSSPR